MDPDADPGGPKTYGSSCGSGSRILLHLPNSSKIKVIKMNEGSGAGSVLVTNGTGSGRGSGSATLLLSTGSSVPVLTANVAKERRI